MAAMKRRDVLRNVMLAAVLLRPCMGLGMEEAASQPEPQKDRETVLDRDNSWARAESEGDIAALDGILDSEFVLTDFDGATYTKKEYMASIRRTKFLSYSVTEQRSQVWGETGIVSGVWRSRWIVEEKEDHGSMRFTAVFVRRGGTWYAVAESVVKMVE